MRGPLPRGPSPWLGGATRPASRGTTAPAPLARPAAAHPLACCRLPSRTRRKLRAGRRARAPRSPADASATPSIACVRHRGSASSSDSSTRAARAAASPRVSCCNLPSSAWLVRTNACQCATRCATGAPLAEDEPDAPPDDAPPDAPDAPDAPADAPPDVPPDAPPGAGEVGEVACPPRCGAGGAVIDGAAERGLGQRLQHERDPSELRRVRDRVRRRVALPPPSVRRRYGVATATGQDLHVVGHARDLRVEQLPVQRDASRGHVGEEGAKAAAALVPFMGVAVRPRAVVVEGCTAAALAADHGPRPRLAQGEPELALRAGRQQRRLEVEQHVSRLRLALEAVSRELERDQPHEELVAAARPRLGRWVEPRLRGQELLHEAHPPVAASVASTARQPANFAGTSPKLSTTSGTNLDYIYTARAAQGRAARLENGTPPPTYQFTFDSAAGSSAATARVAAVPSSRFPASLSAPPLYRWCAALPRSARSCICRVRSCTSTSRPSGSRRLVWMLW
eukprot:scaffold114661_cov60-Phaeocystis_antarctica.AAC.2